MAVGDFLCYFCQHLPAAEALAGGKVTQIAGWKNSSSKHINIQVTSRSFPPGPKLFQPLYSQQTKGAKWYQVQYGRPPTRSSQEELYRYDVILLKKMCAIDVRELL